MGYMIGTTNPGHYGIVNHAIALGFDIEQFVTSGSLPTSAAEGASISPSNQRWNLLKKTGVKLCSVSSEINQTGRYLIKDDYSNHTTSWEVDYSTVPLPYTVTYELMSTESPTSMYLMGEYLSRSPKDFYLEYSDNGNDPTPTWSVHQSWTNQTISDGSPGTFYTFDAPTLPHKWWRLRVTAVSATPSSTFKLARFQLFNSNNYHLTTHPIWYYELPGLSATPSDYSYMNIRANVLYNSFDNLIFSSAVGWIDNTLPMSQPGATHLEKTLTCYSGAMPYWIAANGQRIIPTIKCNTVIRGGYAGKFFPYATPLQYPYPIVFGLNLNSHPNLAYDHASATNPFLGRTANLGILSPLNGTELSGTSLRIWPFDSTLGIGSATSTPLGPSVPVNQPAINGASVTANNTYSFVGSISSYRIIPGMHIRVAGFSNANNNGVKLVTAVGSNSITISTTDLTIETPPGQISIQVIDFTLLPLIIYYEGSAVQSDIYGNFDGVYRIAGLAEISSEDIIYVDNTKHIVFNYGASPNNFFAVKME